jgi:hypothetical protein
MEVLDRGMFQASLAEYGGSVLVWRGPVRSRVGRRCQRFRADDSPEAVWACGTGIGLLTLGPSTVLGSDDALAPRVVIGCAQATSRRCRFRRMPESGSYGAGG